MNRYMLRVQSRGAAIHAGRRQPLRTRHSALTHLFTRLASITLEIVEQAGVRAKAVSMEDRPGSVNIK